MTLKVLMKPHYFSAHAAMALHAFCDEGSEAAFFPFSTVFMTIENTDQKIVTARYALNIFAQGLLILLNKFPRVRLCHT